MDVCGAKQESDVGCSRHKISPSKKRSVCITINPDKKRTGAFNNVTYKKHTDVCGANKEHTGDQSKWCKKQIEDNTEHKTFCCQFEGLKEYC
jgi:hypothetical protein